MDEPTFCCGAAGGYCDRCDLLVDLPGLHVIGVEHDTAGRVVVTVESAPGPVGCPACGVVAIGHGRDVVTLVDAPCFGRPVRVRWRKRRWRCWNLPVPARCSSNRTTGLRRHGAS